MRFLRGKQLNIDQATKQMKEFLEWRKANNVDEIRQDIVYGGRNTPFKFPNAKEILQLQPQIVVTTNAHDKKGNPVGRIFSISSAHHLTILFHSFRYVWI